MARAEIPVDLIEAARKGADSDVERLLKAIWPDAFRLAYSVLGTRQAAEDAAQEACIIVYRSIAGLRSAEAFRFWLYRIVVRVASGLRRSAPPHTPLAQGAFADDCDSTIDVWRALGTLPAKLRDVVVLRYFEGFNSREIAAILNVPDGTIRFRLAIALRRLKPLLQQTSETVIPCEVRTNVFPF